MEYFSQIDEIYLLGVDVDTIISVFCQCVNRNRGYFLGIAILLSGNAKIAVNEAKIAE